MTTVPFLSTQKRRATGVLLEDWGSGGSKGRSGGLGLSDRTDPRSFLCLSASTGGVGRRVVAKRVGRRTGVGDTLRDPDEGTLVGSRNGIH